MHRIDLHGKGAAATHTRVLKTVSFGLADENLLSWAETQGSFSAYVKRLIAQDVKAELPPLDPQLVRLIDRLVEARLSQLGIAPSTGRPSNC